MPRTYDNEFVTFVKQQDPNKTGIALARACIDANLPAKYVAVALKVTRMTLHSWFRGKPIREKNRLIAEVFTDLVESDTAKGILPAKNTLHAKEYIEEMIGRKI